MRVFRCIERMRRVALIAAAAATLLLLIAAVGAGAKTLVQIGGSASPAILAFTTTPHTLNLTVDVRLSSDVPGGDPETIKKTTIFFPHGPRVNGALFPSCSAAKLRRLHGSSRACPRGSRIGRGTALGTSPQLHGVDEQLAVDLYNGAHGRSIVFFLHGVNPVFVSGIIDAPFRAIHNHKWAYQLTLTVPRDLQEIGPGIFASLLRITTHVGATVRVREHGRLVRHGYIEALACPPGALVPVRSVFDFLGGSSASTDGYIGCR
jgi:hypothetical protein